MRVLIVAKTRMGSGACIGGITQNGESVRLISADMDAHDGAGLEYEVGDVWEIEATPAPDITPPHVEDIIVHRKRRLPSFRNPIAIIERFMPPVVGSPAELYEELTQSTSNGSLYVAESGGIPPYSTTFWRADRPLVLDTTSKRIRYRYSTEDGGRTLTFVGYQEPIRSIPAGTLLRVSLAHRWRPDDGSVTEHRCYVQLSGWFLEADDDRELEQFIGHTVPRSKIDVLTQEDLPPLGNTPPSDDSATPLHVLQTVFGYDEFRPLQAEIIANILRRRDTLIIMPTAGGKSLCYQLPALLFGGLTVVVSPLISLMQDQVTQLQHKGVPAVFLNSTLTFEEYQSTTNRIKRGAVKLLYIAPESLLRPETLQMLGECQMDCLAIDEAHCISQWGHDFRREYRQLVKIRERFPNAVCVALTATATPRVRNDIRKALGFRNENEFIASFDRKNLAIAVEPKVDLHKQLLGFLANRHDQSGIIYCATRRQVDELYEELIKDNFSALPYHAGLDTKIREQNQTAFIRDNVRIMVATIAFGMGIDKPDVRFVIHAYLPKNIECYYQEIGRAGRDGRRADCLLLFSHDDVHTIERFIQQGAASEQAGRRKRLTALVDWATTKECRRCGLLGYFGEEYNAGNCQMCDNCSIEADEQVGLSGYFDAEYEADNCQVRNNCQTEAGKQVDLTIPAQNFLLCVLRTGQRFGINHIIDVLRGSRATRVLENGHDELSTYGIGQEYNTEQWKLLAEQFIQQDLLTPDLAHDSVKLTPEGRNVLWREQEVRGASVETQLHRHTVSDETGESVRPTTVPSTRIQGIGERFQAGESIAELVQAERANRHYICVCLDKYARAGNPLPAERLYAQSTLSPENRERVLEIFDELGPDRLRPIFEELNEEICYEELRLIRAIYWTIRSSNS